MMSDELEVSFFSSDRSRTRFLSFSRQLTVNGNLSPTNPAKYTKNSREEGSLDRGIEPFNQPDFLDDRISKRV